LSGTLLRTFNAGRPISCMKYIPALERIVVGTTDGHIIVIATNYSDIEYTYPRAGSDTLNDFVYHSDNFFYASVGRDFYKIDEISATLVGSPFVRGGRMQLDETANVIYYIDLFWGGLTVLDIDTVSNIAIGILDGFEVKNIHTYEGSLYFVDKSYTSFKRVDLATALSVDRVIEDILPNPLSNPESIFLDGNYIYFSDASLKSIKRVNKITKVVNNIYNVPDSSCFVFGGAFKIARHPTQQKMYFNMRCIVSFLYDDGIYEYDDFTTGGSSPQKLHDYDFPYIGDIIVADATPVTLILGVTVPTTDDGTTGGTTGGTNGGTTGGTNGGTSGGNTGGTNGGSDNSDDTNDEPSEASSLLKFVILLTTFLLI